MPQTSINLQGEVLDDQWQLVTDAEQTTVVAHNIIPLSLWQAQSGTLADVKPLGVWLDSDQEPDAIAGDLDHFAIIAINFPAFTDGRGFSIARLLRERYGYTGELRAIGDVIQDQLFYLARCGFSSFTLKPDQNIESAVNSLRPFSNTYQAAFDNTQPLYRRRA